MAADANARYSTHLQAFVYCALSFAFGGITSLNGRDHPQAEGAVHASRMGEVMAGAVGVSFAAYFIISIPGRRNWWRRIGYIAFLRSWAY